MAWSRPGAGFDGVATPASHLAISHRRSCARVGIRPRAGWLFCGWRAVQSGLWASQRFLPRVAEEWLIGKNPRPVRPVRSVGLVFGNRAAAVFLAGGRGYKTALRNPGVLDRFVRNSSRLPGGRHPCPRAVRRDRCKRRRGAKSGSRRFRFIRRRCPLSFARSWSGGRSGPSGIATDNDK